MTAGERQQRTEAADTLARTAYADLGGPDVGVALVAAAGVGGAVALSRRKKSNS